MIIHAFNKLKARLTSDRTLLDLGNKLLGTILTLHNHFNEITASQTVLVSELCEVKRFGNARFLRLLCTDIMGEKYDMLLLDSEVLILVKNRSIFKTVTTKDSIYIKKYEPDKERQE